MSTLVATYAFSPQPNQPFQFQPTLDGAVYTAIIRWNLFGQRYYLHLYTLQGVLVLCIAAVGSPVGTDISLTAGYFTTRLVYRAPTNAFEVIEP